VNSLFDILHPVSGTLRKSGEGKSSSAFANAIEYLLPGDAEKSLASAQVALLGIKSTHKNESDTVREALYSLYLYDSLKIIDLGNIAENEHDNLCSILDELLSKNIFPILFGGSADCTNICYKALEHKSDSLSVTCIMPSVVLNNNYLTRLFLHKTSSLLNLNIIGYQNYLSEPESLDDLSDSYFNTIRLGVLRKDIRDTELVMRDSHLLSVDMSAVRACDAPDTYKPEPNGLYAEEICRLARYAGFSDNIKTVGLFGFDLATTGRQTGMLIAQTLWHILAGFAHRWNENLLNNVNGIKKIIINLSPPLKKLVFYHSETSERWWMEVEISRAASPYIIACSESDYTKACNDEVPLRWLWYHQKIREKFKIY
jgi:hypothetical protein